MKATIPKAPLHQADSGSSPDPREEVNPITGSKFSRKRFLGLLGSGAGVLALPGGLSAKAPQSCGGNRIYH